MRYEIRELPTSYFLPPTSLILAYSHFTIYQYIHNTPHPLHNPTKPAYSKCLDQWRVGLWPGRL